jgi:hypothetical protein
MAVSFTVSPNPPQGGAPVNVTVTTAPDPTAVVKIWINGSLVHEETVAVPPGKSTYNVPSNQSGSTMTVEVSSGGESNRTVVVIA